MGSIIAKEIAEFRMKLEVFYKRVFNTHDPGLPITTLGLPNLLALEDRFVVPDVYDYHNIMVSCTTDTYDSKDSDEMIDGANDSVSSSNNRRAIRSQHTSMMSKQRQAVPD